MGAASASAPPASSSTAVNALLTVAAEIADVRAITVQLKDIEGQVLDHRQEVEIGVYLDAAGADYAATGGSTGIAIGADGKLLTVVAKKLFRAITDATGKLTLTWTDTGTEVAFLGVMLPNGRRVFSSALTNV
jgi:hypothetical protein